MSRSEKTPSPEGQEPAPPGAGRRRRGGTTILPALRTAQVEPVRIKSDEKAPDEQDEMAIILHDPEGFAPQPAVLSPEAFALASLFDGRRTAREIVILFEEKYGAEIEVEQVHHLADELDEVLFLASPRFQEKLRNSILKYLTMPVRPMTHAGENQGYPEDPQKLRETVAAYFAAQDGPGALPKTGPAERHRVPAVILPHLDPRVGGATYAHAYKAILEDCQADLFVILGVGHQGTGDGDFVVSTKPFATPFGTVPVAQGLAARLQEATGVEPALAEYLHWREFSVEFQAVFLRTLLHEHAGRDFEIVPVLCGPVEPYLPEGKSPGRNPVHDERFAPFVERLREELEKSNRRWCVMASVDLSHVGPDFHDMTSMTERLLPPVRRGDQRLLAQIEALNADAFYFEIARTKNSRHWDGVLAILALLGVGRDRFKSGRLLHYSQWLKPTKSVVSVAAMAFDQE